MLQLGLCTGVVSFEIKNCLCINGVVPLNYQHGPVDLAAVIKPIILVDN